MAIDKWMVIRQKGESQNGYSKKTKDKKQERKHFSVKRTLTF